MKKFKAFISLLMAAMIALSCVGTAFAESNPAQVSEQINSETNQQKTYLNEYSYFDESGNNSVRLNDGTTCANIYAFSTSETISDVGLWISRGTDVSVQIRIYKYNSNQGDNSIAKGEVALVNETHEIKEIGKQNIELKSKLDVKQGEKYVIAVTYTAPNNDLMVVTDIKAEDNHCANPGESYYISGSQLTGGMWQDAFDEYGNFYINVLTAEPDQKSAEVRIVNYDADEKISYRQTKKFIAATGNVPASSEIHWLINGEDVCLKDEAGKHTQSKTYSVEKPEKNFTVQVNVVDNGKQICKCEADVTVKNGIIDKIVYFFTVTFVDGLKKFGNLILSFFNILPDITIGKKTIQTSEAAKNAIKVIGELVITFIKMLFK